MRRLIAVIALMALALPVSAQTADCTTEVKSLVADAYAAGHVPKLAVDFLENPTQDDCATVLAYARAFRQRVIDHARSDASQQSTGDMQPAPSEPTEVPVVPKFWSVSFYLI